MKLLHKQNSDQSYDPTTLEPNTIVVIRTGLRCTNMTLQFKASVLDMILRLLHVLHYN